MLARLLLRGAHQQHPLSMSARAASSGVHWMRIWPNGYWGVSPAKMRSCAPTVI